MRFFAVCWHVKLYSYLVDFEASPVDPAVFCAGFWQICQKPHQPITAICRRRERSPFLPDALLSRAVYESYCQCLLTAANERKTGGRFCSPPAPARLRRTSSDTKRFTRTVREADSSTGWREDEQATVVCASAPDPRWQQERGLRRSANNSQATRTAHENRNSPQSFDRCTRSKDHVR